MANTIRFVPKTKHTISYAPLPEPSIRAIPEWYKDHEKYTTEEAQFNKNGTVNETVKKCMAVFDTLTAGYLLKIPVDIMLDATGKRIVYSQANMEEPGIISMHTPEQVKGIPFDREIYMDEVFRVHPQWLVQTEPGVSSLFIHPLLHEDLPFRIIEGIIDTDHFMSDGAFSLLIKRGFKGVLKKGSPLIQVVPFRREDYQMEIPEFEEFEDEVIGQRYVVRSNFEGGYKKNMWQRKRYQ